MKRRLIALLTTAVLLLSFAACGSSTPAEQSADTESASSQAEHASRTSETSSMQAETSSSQSETASSQSGPSSLVIDEELAGLLEDVNPAAEPASCDGFEDLSWGSTLNDLPEAPTTEVVYRGVEFAGYYGSAHYMFDAENRLIMGVYLLNETMSLEWIEALKIYVSIRNHLISEYGLPSEVQRGGGPATIEELIEEGGGAWSEMWSGLSSSDGDPITAYATLQGNGMIEVQFFNMTARRGQAN